MPLISGYQQFVDCHALFEIHIYIYIKVPYATTPMTSRPQLGYVLLEIDKDTAKIITVTFWTRKGP